MRRLRILCSRVFAAFGRRHPDASLNAEIEAHLDQLAADFRLRGLSADDAHSAARRAFGGVEPMKEAYRDQRGFPFLNALAQDVRYALRGMRRAPGFTIVAILTLAMAIGANTAMFSLADALVLKPFPVDRPDQLRALFSVIRVGGRDVKSGAVVNYRVFEGLRAQAEVFSGLMAFGELDELPLDIDGREIRANGAAFVSANYFRVLGVTPSRGRDLAAGEDLPGSGRHLLLLADRFWRRAFDADPGAVGKTLRIGGEVFTVIGITPPDFFGVVLGRAPDVFLPLGALGTAQPGIVTAQSPDFWSVRAVGRMAPNVGDAAAAERLTTLMQAAMPQAVTPKPVIELLPIETGFSNVRTRFLRPVQVLMLMVGILLFIACANVAMMLLSRNVSRRTEIAIRMAVGAGSRRVLQQLTTEGMVLALFGAAIGLLLAPWATHALVALLPGSATPMAIHVAIDARVLLFTAGISLVAALLFAALPAFRAMTLDATSSLANRERGAMQANASLGGWLVAAQIAMSLVVLAGAGLLVRTLHDLSTFNPGYDAERTILLDVSPASRGYEDGRRDAYYRSLLERLESIPGVQSATMSQVGFLEENKTTGTIDVPGFTPASDNERLVQVFLVGPRFFEALGIPLLRGRDFTPSDMSGPRVAALNEAAERRFYGGRNPVGTTIGGGARILAVVADARYNTLRDATVPAMFIPYSQSRLRERMVFSVRTFGGDVSAAIAGEARALDPQVPMRVTTLGSIKERSLSQERLLAVISGFFAATALALLAIGLFGLVTFRVRQRTTEIGVRLALGARTDQVIWLLLQQPVAFALVGMAIGVPATLAVTRLMSSLLFGLTPGDVPTLATATIGVVLIALVAAFWPAWRASRLDPATALRTE